jgi:hypothetical protein
VGRGRHADQPFAGQLAGSEASGPTLRIPLLLASLCGLASIQTQKNPAEGGLDRVAQIGSMDGKAGTLVAHRGSASFADQKSLVSVQTFMVFLPVSRITCMIATCFPGHFRSTRLVTKQSASKAR